MTKQQIVSYFLKAFSICILLIGIYVSIKYKLFKEHFDYFYESMQVYLPILVLGSAGSLYGIAVLLDSSAKKQKNLELTKK